LPKFTFNLLKIELMFLKMRANFGLQQILQFNSQKIHFSLSKNFSKKLSKM